MISIQSIKKAVKLASEFWRRTNKIEKLYFGNNWLECIAECNKAVESEKADFYVYYYLGLSQCNVNFIEESTKNLELALKTSVTRKKNDSIQKYRNYAKYQIAVNFRKSRRYKEAILQLDNSILEDSGYLDFYCLKANIYEDLENTELAIEAVFNGLTVDPKNKQLLELQKNLAYSYSVEQSEKRNAT